MNSAARQLDDFVSPPPMPPHEAPRAPAPRPPSRMLRPGLIESPVRTALRGFAGFLFVYLGAMKISVKTFEHAVLGTRGLELAPGPAGFGQFLAAAGVPFPVFNAYMVIAVEVLCGLGLILGAFVPLAQILTRLFAVALAGDMLVALLVVGVRNVLGHPVMMQGLPTMDQAWRFPLELGMLITAVYFFVRPMLQLVPLFSEKLRILTHPPKLIFAREYARA